MFSVKSSRRCCLIFDRSTAGYAEVDARCRGPGIVGGGVSRIHVCGSSSECGCDVDRCVFDTPLL